MNLAYVRILNQKEKRKLFISSLKLLILLKWCCKVYDFYNAWFLFYFTFSYMFYPYC